MIDEADTSPVAGMSSGEPFMVVTGVILTAPTARGPDETSRDSNAHTQEVFFHEAEMFI